MIVSKVLCIYVCEMNQWKDLTHDIIITMQHTEYTVLGRIQDTPQSQR